MIKGIKFISIPVADQDRALAFYTGKLGFRLTTDQPFDGKQRWLELGIAGAETGVVLFRSDDGPPPGSLMNISFACEDALATAAELEAKGVEFIARAKKESWGTSAIFKDPDGNRFVLSSK